MFARRIEVADRFAGGRAGDVHAELGELAAGAQLPLGAFGAGLGNGGDGVQGGRLEWFGRVLRPWEAGAGQVFW